MMGLSNSSYEAMEREDYDEDEFLELSCLSGKQLDCIIQPVNGKGGVYIGNIEAAQNIHLLDSLKIRAVLTLDDKFDYCYFNCKVSQPSDFSSYFRKKLISSFIVIGTGILDSQAYALPTTISKINSTSCLHKKPLLFRFD